MKNSKLIFIHIHKTGGTAIVQTFKNFGFFKTDKSGHIPYVREEQYKYSTVLRNPIERAFSFFNYTKRCGPSYSLWKFVKNNSFQNYISNYIGVQNGMTRQLCGINLEDKRELNQEHLELAIKNLNEIEYVGITSRLNEFYKKISTNFNGGYNLHPGMTGGYVRLNDLDESIIQTATKYNKLDLELYNVAKNICI